VSEPADSSRLKGTMGARVCEWIGVEIGCVVATEGSYFQVQQPDGTRFWLHQDCINTRNHDEVRLIFPKAQLDRYRLPEPGPPD